MTERTRALNYSEARWEDMGLIIMKVKSLSRLVFAENWFCLFQQLRCAGILSVEPFSPVLYHIWLLCATYTESCGTCCSLKLSYLSISKCWAWGWVLPRACWHSKTLPSTRATFKGGGCSAEEYFSVMPMRVAGRTEVSAQLEFAQGACTCAQRWFQQSKLFE